jgi:hypothetical protein
VVSAAKVERWPGSAAWQDARAIVEGLAGTQVRDKDAADI